MFFSQDKPDEPRLYLYQVQQDKTQLVMLQKAGLISKDLARQLAAAIREAGRLVAKIGAAMLAVDEKNIETVIPGFSHMVHAQTTTLAHQYSAFLSAPERDEERLREPYSRIDRRPLGVGR